MSEQRYTPIELFDEFLLRRSGMSDREFLSRAAHKQTREMWCAAHFGRVYERWNDVPCALWIDTFETYDDSDFDLEFQGERWPIQLTEVQAPGRRRGDEYKLAGPRRPKHDDPSTGTKHGIEWVRSAIEGKLAKRYARQARLNLLVYLNFRAKGLQFRDLSASCRDIARPFASVWLLTHQLMGVIRANPDLPFAEGGFVAFAEELWTE